MQMVVGESRSEHKPANWVKLECALWALHGRVQGRAQAGSIPVCTNYAQ